MKSYALTGSPFENMTSCRMVHVWVRPSDEISGGPVAMSGTSFRLLSNLYRPLNTFRNTSMSIAADMCPGSRWPKSSTIGKLNVWSAASVSDDVDDPPPHAATMESAPIAKAMERTLEPRVIPSLLDTNCKSGARDCCLPRRSIALFPDTGARVRRRRNSAIQRWPPLLQDESLA